MPDMSNEIDDAITFGNRMLRDRTNLESKNRLRGRTIKRNSPAGRHRRNQKTNPVAQERGIRATALTEASKHMSKK